MALFLICCALTVRHILVKQHKLTSKQEAYSSSIWTKSWKGVEILGGSVKRLFRSKKLFLSHENGLLLVYIWVSLCYPLSLYYNVNMHLTFITDSNMRAENNKGLGLGVGGVKILSLLCHSDVAASQHLIRRAITTRVLPQVLDCAQLILTLSLLSGLKKWRRCSCDLWLKQKENVGFYNRLHQHLIQKNVQKHTSICGSRAVGYTKESRSSSALWRFCLVLYVLKLQNLFERQNQT